MDKIVQTKIPVQNRAVKPRGNLSTEYFSIYASTGNVTTSII